MGVINTVAQFERDLLIERTQSGLARAKLNGKALGRPKILSELQRQKVIEHLQEGKAIALVARNFNTSRQTIMRIRDGLRGGIEEVTQSRKYIQYASWVWE